MNLYAGVPLIVVWSLGWMPASLAATIHVPRDHAKIQAAIEAAAAGDTVIVAAGTYQERVRLKEGVVLRSAGDDGRGKLGLLRAEATIIDGGSFLGSGGGVAMAENSTLDGFTVRHVGAYNDAEWKRHHATQGNEQPHEHIGEPGDAGIGINGVTCTVRFNIVHHIGYTGIAIQGIPGKRCSPQIVSNVCYRNMGGGIGSLRGSTATITGNICFQNFFAGIGHDGASPLVVDNECYENIRAGIGISEGSRPVVRGNKCYRNRRAGIGIRTGETTRPVVEDNDCYQNDMAGIGCEEESAPLLRNNRCHENSLAGIGCRDGARPLIIGNKCYRNRAAGIGSEGRAEPLLVGNECYENAESGIGQRGNSNTILVGNDLHHNKSAGIGFAECESGRSIVVKNRSADNGSVAIGVQGGWKVSCVGNELTATAGMPPVVMVFEKSEVDFCDNRFLGSGVAGIRTEGKIRAIHNRFESTALRMGGGPPQFAAWCLPGSEISFAGNEVRGWRHALVADQASVIVSGNRIENYGPIGIQIAQANGPAIAVGNRFISESDRVGVVVKGGKAHIEGNDFLAPAPPPAGKGDQ